MCDLDENHLAELHKKYPEAEIAYDYRQVLKDENIKAIAISTPAVTHYKLVKEALLAGKDVFVEKPMALEVADGEELVDLARSKRRILMVGHILEYHPAIVRLKDLVDKGELGNIKYIYSNRLNLGKFRREENILWSFAPHDISIVLDLLKEMPLEVSAHGGNYLEPKISDVTVTTMTFRSGVKAHIFVSWLHPYKEQKLVVIGGRKMVMFDNINRKGKLYLYTHKIDWIDRVPVPRPEDAQTLDVGDKEPLREECEHFILSVKTRKLPKTDGKSGLQVLKILDACQDSLKENGRVISLEREQTKKYMIHETAVVDRNVDIGKNSKIWHFSHILSNTQIGENCSIGQNVMAGPNVVVGNNVKIQNNVSVYDGVVLEDDVFCGPSMVFTNVTNPRSHWPRKDEFRKTLVQKGATLGANSTIVCGNTIGRYAFIGAGALVNKDIPDYALVYGVPARIQGWICYCGNRLELSNSPDSKEKGECSACGRKYQKNKLIVEQMSD
jgi:UDP-2-acetamido-3-amino-2,3-dideoxy-glucuronate N-acetyltransferase